MVGLLAGRKKLKIQNLQNQNPNTGVPATGAAHEQSRSVLQSLPLQQPPHQQPPAENSSVNRALNFGGPLVNGAGVPVFQQRANSAPGVQFAPTPPRAGARSRMIIGHENGGAHAAEVDTVPFFSGGEGSCAPDAGVKTPERAFGDITPTAPYTETMSPGARDDDDV